LFAPQLPVCQQPVGQASRNTVVTRARGTCPALEPDPTRRRRRRELSVCPRRRHLPRPHLSPPTLHRFALAAPQLSAPSKARVWKTVARCEPRAGGARCAGTGSHAAATAGTGAAGAATAGGRRGGDRRSGRMLRRQPIPHEKVKTFCSKKLSATSIPGCQGRCQCRSSQAGTVAVLWDTILCLFLLKRGRRSGGGGGGSVRGQALQERVEVRRHRCNGSFICILLISI